MTRTTRSTGRATPDRAETDRAAAVRAGRVAVLLVVAVLAAACGSSGGSSGSGSPASTSVGSPEESATRAAEPAYEQAGPYVPGVTTLEMDGRKVEVWYPADPGAENGAMHDIFRISTLLPDDLKSLVPPDLDPKYATDAFRDIPASDEGPFPMVLFSHGFAAYSAMYSFLTTHLASWGFVVVAPNHEERGLFAALAGCVKPSDDAAVLLAARDLVVEQSKDPASELHDTADPTKVATIGHSAGASAAVTAARDASVATYVALDGGGVRPSSGATTPTTTEAGCIATTSTTTADASTTTTAIQAGDLPAKPGMLITGGKDAVIPLDRLQPIYEQLAAPKRLVVIDGAGHNSVTDICLIGADQGGLLAIAAKIGVPVPDQVGRLFDDGCAADGGYAEVTQVWKVPRHFVVAQLRYVFGIDAEPVGLGPGIADAFAPVTLTYAYTN